MYKNSDAVKRFSINARWALALVALLVFSTAGAADRLKPVDRVAVDDMPEPVQEAIDQAYVQLEQLQHEQAGGGVLAAAFGQLGEVLFAHGFTPQARTAFENAATLAPDALDWRYLLGVIETAEGRLDKALEHFDRALEIHDWDVATLMRRGQAYLEQGRLEPAASDFNRVLRVNPESAAALAGLGRVALERDEPEQAIEHLEQALTLDSGATRLYQSLGIAYRGLGEVDRARELLGRAGTGVASFDDPVIDRVSARSRSPQFYLELALARAEEGDLEASLRLLVNAVHLSPEDVTIMRHYAVMLARVGEYAEALNAIGRLVELDPDSVETRYFLGQIEEIRGELDQARAAYRKALEIDSDFDPAREALVFLSLRQGEFAAAADDFARLAGQADDPAKRQRLLFWQAMSHIGKDDCARAKTLLHEAREQVEAFDGSVMSALARVRATCGQASDEELAEALSWAELVYDMEPEMETAATLAMVSAAMGRFDDAIDFQAQAIFEALRDGVLEQRPDLQENMALYQDNRPAEQPYTADHPIFTAGLNG